MTEAPRVSILLPYRDAAATLEEAIASVLCERLPLELVAIDDGSRDGGPDLVARLAARDRRVVPVATGGVGIARALAAGATTARCAFVARMDADDVSIAPRVEACVERLARDPSLGAVASRVVAFPDEAVGEGARRYVAWQNGLVSPDDHARDLFVESPLCHPAVTLRRSALEAVGGYVDVPWAEDYDLFLRLAAAGFGLAKVDLVGLRWRHHARRATLLDPRYAPPMFDRLKARYLAPRLRAEGLPVAVWGAGPTGKRLARALEGEGIRAELFIDIDPRKIGSTRRGAPVRDPSALERGAWALVVAVGTRGARALIRAALAEKGFVEGPDYVCAA